MTLRNTKENSVIARSEATWQPHEPSVNQNRLPRYARNDSFNLVDLVKIYDAVERSKVALRYCVPTALAKLAGQAQE